MINEHDPVAVAHATRLRLWFRHLGTPFRHAESSPYATSLASDNSEQTELVVPGEFVHGVSAGTNVVSPQMGSMGKWPSVSYFHSTQT